MRVCILWSQIGRPAKYFPSIPSSSSSMATSSVRDLHKRFLGFEDSHVEPLWRNCHGDCGGLNFFLVFFVVVPHLNCVFTWRTQIIQVANPDLGFHDCSGR